MAVLSGSVPVRFGSRFLAVPRFMLVLNTCTPLRTRGNAGEYRACAVSVWWEGNLLSLLLRRNNKQGWGCWAGDAGEYRFWNIWGLRVLKTCTPPRARGNAGNTDHVLTLSGGKETYDRCFFGEAISRVADAGPRTRGSTGFGTFGA